VRLNIVRREQTLLELERLEAAMIRWLSLRRAQDYDGNVYVGRHETQLQAIEQVLTGGADALRRSLDHLDTTRATGEIYEECRACDEAIVWLERLWTYFREKFDQRNDVPADNQPGLANRTSYLLHGADEVVWSCYREVFIRAVVRDPTLAIQRPSPLSFIKPHYSPAAVLTDEPLPPVLRLSAEVKFLDEYLERLPVPVLQLPPWCLEQPWWLVLIGHETGHHIQHDLNLIEFFRTGIERAVSEFSEKNPADGLSATDVARWGRWGRRFSQTFSHCL
jgi:hypothetical protein